MSEDIFGGKEGLDGIGDLFKKLGINDKMLNAQMNDQRLSKLAEYDLTKGYMTIKVSGEQIQTRFNELKRIVKTGENTLKDLEDEVYERWGVDEERRMDALQKETLSPEREKSIIGFNIDDIEVADMKENDKRNH
jgi:hypothetical protein